MERALMSACEKVALVAEQRTEHGDPGAEIIALRARANVVPEMIESLRNRGDARRNSTEIAIEDHQSRADDGQAQIA
jgi:hypothetical protein